MLMIVVYSGFWILYFQNFGSVLWYLRDFVDRAPVSAAVTSLLQRLGLPWTFTLRRRARHRHQRRHDHPAAGARQPHRQEPAGAADDGHRHGHRRARLPAAGLSRNAWVFIARHRGLLDRRDDRPPEVLQLRRPRRARGPQGRLHGLRVPLRRLRLAARLEPRRLPLRADAQAGGRHARGRRPRAAVLADLRRARRGRRGRRSCSSPAPSARTRPRRAAAPPGSWRRLRRDRCCSARCSCTSRSRAEPLAAPHRGAGGDLPRAGRRRAGDELGGSGRPDQLPARNSRYASLSSSATSR